MDQKIIVSVIATAIVAGGIGYWIGGSSSSTSTQTTGRSASMQGTGQRGSFGGGSGNSTMGTIVAMDGQSITVQLGGQNASSTNGTSTGTKLVIVASSTQVGKFVEGSIGDLAQGDNVMVSGTSNSDGSLTATMIQIRPARGTMDGASRASQGQ